MKSNIEKVVYSVYKNCTLIKDIHDAAYLLNYEYKRFWDWHPTESKEKLLKQQRLMTISNKAEKIHEGVIHFATGGLSFLAKKLFQKGKPTREEQIQAYVTSKDFTDTMSVINSVLADMTNELAGYFSEISNNIDKEESL